MVDTGSIGFDIATRQPTLIPRDMHNLITRENFAPPQKSNETAKVARRVMRSLTHNKATFTRERNFFIRLVSEKLKREMTFCDGMPASMIQVVEFFKELKYQLTGEQLNDLFLNHLSAGA